MNKIAQRIGFHKSGRPRRWLIALLVDRAGRVRPAFRRVVFKKNGLPRPRYAVLLNKGNSLAGTTRQVAVDMHVQDWLDERFSALRPLTVFKDTAATNRINLVTDSIGASSLFGGVGTAIILAALWAKRTDAELRIITRGEPPSTKAVSTVLSANGLHFDGPVAFVHAPHFNSDEIAVSSNDMFLATSWWTARSLLNTVPSDRIVYLLQEDERMFYPYGDDHLNCSNALAEPFAKVIVNTGLLHRHMTEGHDAVPGLASRSVSFEPAFVYPLKKSSAVHTGKRKMFVYARPHNDRNLYATCLQLINQAIIEGVLNPKDWELHLVGRGLEKRVFDGGLVVRFHDPMAWNDYITFLQTMDAGLSFMYTPHPSYPPLDLAAIGVPVLTNRFGVKSDLSSYSKNILCTDLTMPAMLDGLRQLLALATDPQTCAVNMAGDHINRDWEAALEDVIVQLADLTDGRHLHVS
ncbi:MULTISPECIES: hypothetical protein [unclassified Yoonia]|uniref:rhamnosyltransferase WsaF family glycosyltransferase n=1 Tax=unclassified Yoonia TaxID=2629118 RepID=UPI002AFF5AAF|nr:MULTISPECIES: hypothetical protein [unclassified Yoonia]